ncbi:MAG: hypothetical protein K940chlam8_00220 [Chlamydiae bacterium]|nr:hypothetical protein [Chlamydiota bacterium]
MKVLQINDSLIGGGAEVVFRYTSELLKKAGYDVKSFYHSKFLIHSIGYIYSFKSCFRLKKVIEDFQPDVIHFHNFHHLLSPSVLYAIKKLKKRLGFKVFMTVHDYHLICTNNGCIHWKKAEPINCESCQGKKFYKGLFYKCDHRGILFSFMKFLQHFIAYNFFKLQNVIDTFICPSNFLKNKLEISLPQNKLHVLNNPAFGLAHNLDEITAAAKVIQQKYESVFLGRISIEKGLHRFLEETYSKEKFGNVAIIGDGPKKYKKMLEGIVQKRHLEKNVFFLGPKDHLEALSYLYNAKRLIFPSIWYENCPLTILEAIYLKKEIFHYGIGAADEISSLDRKEISEEKYLEGLLKLYPQEVKQKAKVCLEKTS